MFYDKKHSLGRSIYIHTTLLNLELTRINSKKEKSRRSAFYAHSTQSGKIQCLMPILQARLRAVASCQDLDSTLKVPQAHHLTKLLHALLSLKISPVCSPITHLSYKISSTLSIHLLRGSPISSPSNLHETLKTFLPALKFPQTYCLAFV